MHVAVLRVSFTLHGNDSLKEKRRVVKSLLERTRNKFGVSTAEVADQDVHRRAVLGVAVVGSEAKVLNALLDHVIEFMDSLQLAEMTDHEMEVITL